jgi:hypothetical protein
MKMSKSLKPAVILFVLSAVMAGCASKPVEPVYQPEYIVLNTRTVSNVPNPPRALPPQCQQGGQMDYYNANPCFQGAAPAPAYYAPQPSYNSLAPTMYGPSYPNGAPLPVQPRANYYPAPSYAPSAYTPPASYAPPMAYAPAPQAPAPQMAYNPTVTVAPSSSTVTVSPSYPASSYSSNASAYGSLPQTTYAPATTLPTVTRPPVMAPAGAPQVVYDYNGYAPSTTTTVIAPSASSGGYPYISN